MTRIALFACVFGLLWTTAVCAGELVVPPVFAQDFNAEAEFTDANKLYEQSNYGAALQKYLLLDSLGYQSGELYFNIGNAFYKTGAIGRAILYYEKAKRFLGEDDDVQNNLEIARLRTQDKIPQMPPFFLDAVASKFLGAFSIGTLAFLFAASVYLLVGVVILHIKNFLPNNIIFRVSQTLCVIFVAFFGTMFIAKAYRESSTTEGVTIAPTLSAKSEPRDQSTTLFVVHEGLKVQLARSEGDWVEIKLPDGNKGWVRAAQVGIIQP